ncbi:blastoderm-specific gene 25D [Temnothorax americanus]|uniref:blastoderm-specific gene 25D n=1 Tax=Temnothorax americanus TaxID=1964332 RepID=UPI004067805E
MAERSSDLYEQQLLAVFKSCLTKGEDELDETDLFSICTKLHLDDVIEELKLCICKHRPNKQTISFQEFRDGLLLLLRKFQGLITDKQHIVQPYHTLNICSLDIEKDQALPLVTSTSSTVRLRDMKANVIMDENRLIRLWERVKVYLRGNTDSATMHFISSCLEIPELPKQITESIFESLDHNCDGLISFDEFVVIFQKRTSMKALQREDTALSRNSIVDVNYDVDTLDINTRASCECNPIRTTGASDKSDEKKVVASVSDARAVSSSSRDLDALDTSLAEIANIICDELKSLNESLGNSTIQTHIRLLREMMIVHQDEQRTLIATVDNMKLEREKMRIDMLEANERANLLAQEIDECHVHVEKTKKDLQRQSEQRYAEITKELSDQLNIEREMDAAALKSKEDQLLALQKENHDMRNKVVDILQESQMLEAENKMLLGQIEKLRQSNNDLLTQIKVLDAEHDEIQSIEAKQQEQVNFFVDRIKQLQSEVTLLRDQNDELGAELENLKCYGKDTRYEIPASLAYDLQLDENSCHMAQEFQVDRQRKHEGASYDGFGASMNGQGQTDMIVKDLENVLSTSAKCLPEKCALRDGISSVITGLRASFAFVRCPSRENVPFGKSIASELEVECEERANESLRDLVVSKIPKPPSAKRTTMSNSAEALDTFAGQDAKNLTQTKATSLRDYPPRKEEHPVDQCKANKERTSPPNVTEVESVAPNVNVATANVDVLEREKKHVTERCQELERSLDLLKAEYEECEDYWAAKLEEERQLFEQEQKISDDKFAELITKITEYEELRSPSDKSKSNGRLSPIEEKFNLEQQYIELEEEFEKWKVKTENDISQKNLEIGDLREKLRLIEQSRTTAASYVQVPDERSLATFSASSPCKSSSTSSILSTNEMFANMALCGTNDQTCHTSADVPLSNTLDSVLKQNDHIDGHTLYNTGHTECPIKVRKGISRDQKMSHTNLHVAAKTMLAMKEEDEEGESDVNMIRDVMKETSCTCSQSTSQQQVGCVDLNIFQNLKVKLYAQERKKRHLQRYIKQQRQYIEKLLQRIIVQHQTEVCELQCLLRDTQERLQIQVQTTVDQADKLASADIVVKDLYIENACITSHMKRLQERCLVLTGLDVGSTSM